MILSLESFIAHTPLLTATSAFGLGRKRWSSPQQCYLHCLYTIMVPKIWCVEKCAIFGQQGYVGSYIARGRNATFSVKIWLRFIRNIGSEYLFAEVLNNWEIYESFCSPCTKWQWNVPKIVWVLLIHFEHICSQVQCLFCMNYMYLISLQYSAYRFINLLLVGPGCIICIVIGGSEGPGKLVLDGSAH